MTVVLVVCCALVVGGLVSYLSLPLEAFPDIDIPYVMINTRYRGVSPLDVEKSITIKIENEMKIRTIPKATNKFEIIKDDEVLLLDGVGLLGRPEDRIMKVN